MGSMILNQLLSPLVVYVLTVRNDMMKKQINRLKQFSIGVIITVVIVISPVVKADTIHTFDVASFTQTVTQIENQIRQIEKMHNQLQSATGNANLGTLLNDPNVSKALAKYTPQGINLKDLADGNYDRTLQDIVKRIETDVKNGHKLQDLKAQVVQAQLINMASVEQAMNTLNVLAKRSQQIFNQINSTTDVSSKADLANTLQANATQIQILVAQANLQLKHMELLEKRAKEIAEKHSFNKLLGK